MHFILLSVIEGIGGFLMVIVFTGGTIFLISIFSRLTGTKVITRGGTVIPPFRTPQEIKDENTKLTIEAFVREVLNIKEQRDKPQIKSFTELSPGLDSFVKTISEREANYQYSVSKISSNKQVKVIAQYYESTKTLYLKGELTHFDYSSIIEKAYDQIMDK